MPIYLDPLKVSLLLHGDPPIVDRGAAPKTLSVGGVTSTNSVSALGGSSLQCASGEPIKIAAHADFNFGTGDFAIELRFRRLSNTGRNFILGQVAANGDAASAAFVVEITASNTLSCYSLSGNTEVGRVSTTASVSDGVFYCVEYSRSGSTFRLRVNGSTVATATSAAAINSSVENLAVFALGDLTSLRFYGYIDELVIFKGGLLHSADYTPATQEYITAIPVFLSGVVKDATDTPVARVIQAYREDTGASAGSATSDESTGAYSIPSVHSGAHTLIAYPAAGENLPALALRGVIPV